ncbi:SusC/RagA family TonB-linked outer membrane protein [Zhouia sp. PK063]|uniref:SusC/RagA family TonB-linked outer membrane protein n=1 Tax=Zhouia sp. PK063 TaxID=3373602 RepID=UPI0037BB1D8F
MRSKFTWIVTLCMALIMQFSFAQEKRITGKVTDKDNLPLPGVNIVVKGTANGTQTDFDGNFSISASVGQKLVFTYVGQKSQEVTVGDSSVINIQMKDDAQALDEVVVIGYGTRNKRDVVGSVSTVSSKVLNKRPAANVMDAMQGQVAGLQVFTSSGEPSETPSFRLHGTGSLGGGSYPLVVLDGMPINQDMIVSLNPNDFESITVLKDASATAIYGSRAANGVVVITSKKGSKGAAPQITLSAQYGVSNLANKDPFTSVMNTKELTDFWIETGFRSQDQVNTLLDQYPNDTQWYKAYYKEDAPTSQINLSLSGGSEKTKYYISSGYFNQEGLAYRSKYEKYTLRSNITSDIQDWIRLGLNLTMSTDQRELNGWGANSTNRGLALLAQPFYSYLDDNGDRYQGLIPGWGRYDPEYLANKNPNDQNKITFLPTAYIELKPFKGLTLKTQGGLEFYDYRTTSHRLPSYLGSLNNGSSYEDFSRGLRKTITNTAEYKFAFDELHHFNLLAGQEWIDFDWNYFTASSSGQTDDRLIMLGQGPNNQQVGQSKQEYAYRSYFGRVSYDFDSKYYLDLSLRNDASSRFGRDNRYATFYAVGLKWNAKQEQFLQNLEWLKDLQLRASYGTSGNSGSESDTNENYLSLATVGTNQYNGSTGWYLSYPGNSTLQWESQKQFDLGLDVNIMDRVRLSLEYYRRTTSNMLVDVPYPYTSGFSQIKSNIGELENNGIDVTLNFDVYKNDESDAYITPYVNFNYNKNEVTKLFQGKDFWVIPNTGVSWAVGKPVSYFYPIYKGVNSETGAPEWYVPGENVADTRKDDTAVTSDFNSNTLQQNTGIKREAPLNGGFGLNAGYRGFYLTADFTFSSGKHLINNDRYFFENPNVFTGYNQNKSVQDYWKQPGDQTRFPDYNNYQFTQFDSNLIEDASFMRLKNLTIGYRFPSSLLEKSKVIKGANLYVTGRNLLTFTKYTGPDPEVDSNLGLGTNPNTKQMTVGIDIQL